MELYMVGNCVGAGLSRDHLEVLRINRGVNPLLPFN